MPLVFSRSIRSIETDGYRRTGLVFAIALALVVGWTGWFVFARVAVVEVAETARLEVDQAAHTVDAPVAGRVTSSRLVLGQAVRDGDVLAELDTQHLRLSLAQEKAKQAAFAPQIAALTQEIEADERALEDSRYVAQVRVDEARTRRREAESFLRLANTELARAQRLRVEGLTSEAEVARSSFDAEQRRAAFDGANVAMTRIEAEQRAVETERRATIASRRRDLAQIQGQQAMSVAMLAELAQGIELRQIRAPITGKLGEVAVVGIGTVVKEGDKLGAIIPNGNLRIVAEFLPAAAIARVRPGQHAKMRPEGFPWTQYGMLSATVRRVADEPRLGRIRVELDVDEGQASPIPIQHGLPGTLEIEIEKASPAALVFRAAGRRLAAPVAQVSPTRQGAPGGEDRGP